MAWFLAFSLGVLFVSQRPSWSTLVASVGVAIGVVGLTAPWWATVIQRHGVAPFLAASQGGSLLGAVASSGSGLTIALGLLVLLSILLSMVLSRDRRWTLVAWVGLIVVLDSRNVAWLPTVPLALGLGALIGEGLVPQLSRTQERHSAHAGKAPAAAGLIANSLASALLISVVIFPLLW